MIVGTETIQVLLTMRDNLAPGFNKVKASLNSLGRAFKATSKLVAQMSAAIAGLNVLSIGALTAAGIKSASEVNRVAGILGETTSDVYELFLNLRTLNPGAELDNISEGLRTLTERFSEARSGSGDAFDALNRLGLDTSLEGPIEQLRATRDALKEISSQSEFVELTNILFGDTDANALVGYLKATDETLRSIGQAKRDLGLLVDEQDFANVRELKVALSEVQAIFETLAIKVAGVVSEQFKNLAATFLAWVEANGGVANFVDSVFNIVSEKLSTLVETFRQAASFIQGIWFKLTGDINQLSVDQLKIERDRLEGVLSASGFDRLLNTFSGESKRDALESLEEVNRKIEELEEGAVKPLAASTQEAADKWKEYIDGVVRASAEQAKLVRGLRSATTAQNELNAAAASAPIEVSPFQVNGIDLTDTSGVSPNPSTQQVGDVSSFADDAKQAQNVAGQLQSAIGSLGSAFGQLGNSSDAAGKKMFERFQKVSAAIAAVSALTIAIQAAQQASSGGPVAALAAYIGVAAAFFQVVSAIKNINTDSVPDSPPGIGGGGGGGGGGGNTGGPQGGTGTAQQGAASVVNITLPETGNVDATTVAALLRYLQNNESDSRALQLVINGQ